MKVEVSILQDISKYNVHPGNRVDLEIVLSHKDNCEYLPIGAVQKTNNAYFVRLEKDQQLHKVEVGVQDQSRIEIISGIKFNEGVIYDRFN